MSVHYDPMIAKLVVWGEDRNTALSRLISALQRYQVFHKFIFKEFMNSCENIV